MGAVKDWNRLQFSSSLEGLRHAAGCRSGFSCQQVTFWKNHKSDLDPGVGEQHCSVIPYIHPCIHDLFIKVVKKKILKKRHTKYFKRYTAAYLK